jgi:type II secretory pathway pseudopilin PulG
MGERSIPDASKASRQQCLAGSNPAPSVNSMENSKIACKAKSRESAFTLPELLLAAAILAFALGSLIMIFVTCSFLIESSRNLGVAVSHATYVMEEIRGADFSGLEARIATDEEWDLTAQEIQSPPYNLTALGDESIDASVTQSGNPLGVSVRVDWNDRGGKPRNIVLETLITDY